MKRLLVVIAALISVGCRSAGTLALAVTSEDPSHTAVPLYLELLDESGRRVAITSAKVIASAPLELRLRRVLDGRRYQARWWLDLDGDGAPSSTADGAEPAFVQGLSGTSDLTLWYPTASWETPAVERAAAIPPFCQLSGCGPAAGGKDCPPDQKCLFYAASGQWICCSKSPYALPTPAPLPKR